MLDKAQKKRINRLVNLFSVIYSAGYVMRYGFSAVAVEVVSATGIRKDLLSIAFTGAFITYGIGQVVSGVLGDRFSPKRLLSLGFAVSSIMNLIIPFCSGPYLIAVIWCINGFAQAFTWPPLLRLMTEHIPPDVFAKYTQRVSWFANIGRISVYIIAPLLVWLISWKAMLFFAGIFGLLMLAVWEKTGPDAAPAPKRETSEGSAPAKEQPAATGQRLFAPVLIGILLAAVMVGVFRDGVQTWTPTFLAEAHGLSNITSILSGVFLPAAGILFVMITTFIYRSWSRNILACAGIMFFAGVAAVVVYRLFGQSSAAVAVVCSAVLVGSSSGSNYMLTVVQPSFYRKIGRSSTAAGVINAAVYVGSSASTYGFAAIAQNTGWDGIVTSWLIMAAVGAAACFAFTLQWKKEFRRG